LLGVTSHPQNETSYFMGLLVPSASYETTALHYFVQHLDLDQLYAPLPIRATLNIEAAAATATELPPLLVILQSHVYYTMALLISLTQKI
jgi:hypothetical protein